MDQQAVAAHGQAMAGRRSLSLDGVWRFFAHDGDEDLGMAQVAADIHSGDGHQTDAWVLDFTADQLGQLTLHLITDTLGTAVFFGHSCYL